METQCPSEIIVPQASAYIKYIAWINVNFHFRVVVTEDISPLINVYAPIVLKKYWKYSAVLYLYE